MIRARENIIEAAASRWEAAVLRCLDKALTGARMFLVFAGKGVR